MDVTAKPVDWLWPDRIAKGAITVLAGRPGLGKSTLSLTLAAQLSRGDLVGDACNVLLASAEESLEYVVRPRLEAAGADLARIYTAEMEDGEGYPRQLLLPDDVQRLRQLIVEKQAGLVVIDPLSAHLAGPINSWMDQSVRLALAPLRRIAEETGAAILLVAHLNKGQSDDPLHRLGGSIGIPAAARSVLLLGLDPDDPAGESGDRRVLAHAKNNLGRLGDSLLLELETATVQSGTTVRIQERGRSPHTARDLLATDNSRPPKPRDQAATLLIETLTKGPQPVTLLEQLAHANGISSKTLTRAKRDLRIESSKPGLNDGWEWSLPSDTAEQAA